jgi:hypothetical protein
MNIISELVQKKQFFLGFSTLDAKNPNSIWYES